MIAEKYDFDRTYTHILKHADYMLNKLPYKLTDDHKKVLKSNCFTFFGRDKYYRPIHIMKPLCLYKIPLVSDNVKVESVIFANLYAKKYMNALGKAEALVIIYDFENTSLKDIPYFPLISIGR